jgi:hypothetical protein
MTAQEQFDKAASEVIHATLKIYVEVGHLLRDLRSQLQESMSVFALASISDGDPALKVLKGWRGFLGAPGLYEPGKKKRSQQLEADEEEAEDDKGAGKMLKVQSGGNLLFGKFVLHEFPRRVEPCFLGGVLCGATIAGEGVAAARAFTFKSVYGKGILRDLNSTTWSGRSVLVQTDAKIHTPSGHSKRKGKRAPKLQFELRHKPLLLSLWELDGTDGAQKLADDLLKQWNSVAGKSEPIRK